MRVGSIRAMLGVRDADELEQVDRPGLGRLPGDTSSCARMASAICTPIVYTGFSEVIGSWKTIAIRLPRTSASSFSLSPSSSPAAERHRAGDLGRARAADPCTAIDVTDLPEPDSPTMPSTSPRSQVEAHAAHGVHHAVVGREAHVRSSIEQGVGPEPARVDRVD